MQTIQAQKVSISWNCEKCKANGVFETERENIQEYLAYYRVLLEQHGKHKKRKNCKFVPEKIHVTSVKQNGVELQK